MDIKFLILYLLILFVNVVVNAQFYFNSRKKKEYKWTMLFWVSFFVHFILQGALESNHQALGISMFLGSFAYFFVLKLFGSLFNVVVDEKFYLKIYGYLLALGVALSFVAPFQVFTIPLVVCAVIPYFHFAWKHWKQIKETPLFLRSAFWFVALSLIHVLDYPFLRLEPEASEIGFFVAFMTNIFFSLVVHFISDSIYIKAIEDELKKTIEDKNKLSRNLMALELVNSFSHEINNSLQVIESSNEMISLYSSNNGDKKTLKLTSNINDGLTRIFSMFNLFNESKRSESLSVESLDNLLKEVFSLVDVHLKSAKTKLSISEIPQVKIFSSKGIFCQVIVNVLTQFLNSKNKEVSIQFDPLTHSMIVSTPYYKSQSVNLELATVLANQINLKIENNLNGVVISYKTVSYSISEDDKSTKVS